MDHIQPVSSKYEIITTIGKGAYGEVYKSKEIETSAIVAMKKILMKNQKNGFPSNAIREIRLLKSLDHRNIIRLRNVITCGEKRDVYLVFDYCPFDLKGLIYRNASDTSSLSLKQIKCYMRQMILGIFYCHHRYIIHRDIKPDNILINIYNEVKIADFGLARIFYPKPEDKNPESEPWNVITLHYRPPELLLGAKEYGPEIDVWSLACTFYEMITSKILFRPKNNKEEDQLIAIFEIMGIPTNYSWPDHHKLQFYKPEMFSSQRVVRKADSLEDHLLKTLPTEFHDSISLFQKMLEFDPKKRCTSKEVFLHPFLSSPNRIYEPENLEPLHIEDQHSNVVIERLMKMEINK